MKTAVVTIRKEPYYRRAAVDTGLKRLGYSVVSAGTKPHSKHDLLILWNKKAGREEEQADRWEREGGIVIIMENGYLQKVDKTFYAISVHGHNGSGWFPVGDEDRFAKLGFKLRPWREMKGEVLVRAQRGVGSRLMASPSQWAEKMVAKLKGNGTVARLVPHPGDKMKLQRDFDALAKAKLLHIWSSAMGVRALVEGVPVIHHAPHWICEGATRSYPYMHDGDRLAALRKMAWGQYHFEEIATGEPFARILAALKDNR